MRSMVEGAEAGVVASEARGIGDGVRPSDTRLPASPLHRFAVPLPRWGRIGRIYLPLTRAFRPASTPSRLVSTAVAGMRRTSMPRRFSHRVRSAS